MCEPCEVTVGTGDTAASKFSLLFEASSPVLNVKVTSATQGDVSVTGWRAVGTIEVVACLLGLIERK